MAEGERGLWGNASKRRAITSRARLGLDLTRSEALAEERLRLTDGAAARAEARLEGTK